MERHVAIPRHLFNGNNSAGIDFDLRQSLRRDDTDISAEEFG